MHSKTDLDKNILELLDTVKPESIDSTETASVSIFEKIQDQRHQQRKEIMSFSRNIAGWSTFAIFILIFLQASARIFCDKNFEVLSTYQLNIISTAVILQSFGIILVITKALWNDRDYTSLLKQDFKNKKQQNTHFPSNFTEK